MAPGLNPQDNLRNICRELDALFQTVVILSCDRLQTALGPSETKRVNVTLLVPHKEPHSVYCRNIAKRSPKKTTPNLGKAGLRRLEVLGHCPVFVVAPDQLRREGAD